MSARWQPSYLLPICGFGICLLEQCLNQSVSDKTSMDCLMCAVKQRVPEGEKKEMLAMICTVIFFRAFFSLFLNVI